MHVHRHDHGIDHVDDYDYVYGVRRLDSVVVIVIEPVIVIGPVGVAVHLNGNDTVIVIKPVIVVVNVDG